MESFEGCVTQHGPAVLRVCRAVLGVGADAEDAWSETFLAALADWPNLQRATSVEAWLVRVARFKCADVVRGRIRQENAAEATAAEQRLAPFPQPSDVLSAGPWDLVARLPETQRLAVAYHFFGGLSHAETAELLESTPAAVRRASSDGIAALRRSLVVARKETL